MIKAFALILITTLTPFSLFAGWGYTVPVTEVYLDYNSGNPILMIKQSKMWSPKGEACLATNGEVKYYVVKGDAKKIDQIYSAALTSYATKSVMRFGVSSCDSLGNPDVWGFQLM